MGAIEGESFVWKLMCYFRHVESEVPVAHPGGNVESDVSEAWENSQSEV